jgi:hypothetical protein
VPKAGRGGLDLVLVMTPILAPFSDNASGASLRAESG